MTSHRVRDLVDHVHEEFAELFVVEALLDASAESCHLVVREQAPPSRRLLVQVLARRALRARGLDATLGALLTRLRAFQHPGAIPLERSGENEHLRWAAFAAPGGPTLADRLRERGAFDRAASLRMMGTIAEVLDAAHAQGLSHGDLRAAHVIVLPDGRLQLGGFGVAAAVEALAGMPVPAATPAGDLGRLGRLYLACRLGLPNVVDEDQVAPADARFNPIEREALARAFGGSAEGPFANAVDFVAALRVSARATPRSTPPSAPQPLLFVDAPRHTNAAWRVGVVASLILLGAMPAQRLWIVETSAPVIPPVRRSAMAPPPELPEDLPPAAPQAAPPAAPPVSGSPVRAAPLVEDDEPRSPVAPPPRPTPPADQAAVNASPGELGVSTMPWGHLYVDGRYIGDTPVLAHAVDVGAHIVRIVRPGYRPVERSIVVRPGERVRLTDLELARVTP